MPCAAPCNRLPCDERCDKLLACGHRCPSFCGEECPDRAFCPICGDKQDACVDLTEFQVYANINLDELPIVALACGHFYTGENLDLLAGMGEVYTVDSKGEYNGLKGISAALAKEVAVCPECRRPIRQFSTRRYNRAINKAVMDETTKRLLASGRQSLGDLEKRFETVEESFRSGAIVGAANDRYSEAFRLSHDVASLRDRMKADYQPAKRLHDAIITRQRGEMTTLAARMEGLGISQAAPDFSSPDKQIMLKASLLHGRVDAAILQDKFKARKAGEMPVDPARVARFLKSCAALVADATESSLPRISVQATLVYASVYRVLGSGSDLRAQQEKTHSLPWDHDTVREKLADAASLCNGLPDAEELRGAVDATIRLFEGSRYEEITADELEAVKRAMVSGHDGMATHSGHWYNCANGHPVRKNPFFQFFKKKEKHHDLWIEEFVLHTLAD